MENNFQNNKQDLQVNNSNRKKYEIISQMMRHARSKWKMIISLIDSNMGQSSQTDAFTCKVLSAKVARLSCLEIMFLAMQMGIQGVIGTIVLKTLVEDRDLLPKPFDNLSAM